MMHKIKRIGLPVLILIVGTVLMAVMINSREQPEKTERKQTSRTVKVRSFTPWSGPIEIRTSGTIKPADSVDITPQVRGKIIYVSPRVRNGSFVKKGQLIFRIAAKEYKLRVKAAKAQVSSAGIQLRTERERAGVAQKEWDRYTRDNPDAEPGTLLLREPQIKTAEVALESARASLDVAELNLRRTTIRAPFNGFVAQKFISRGQVVAPGMKLARIVSLKSEIAAGVKMEETSWLPDIHADKDEKINARVHFPASGMTMDGIVRRAEPLLDTSSRMVNYIVELENRRKNPVQYGAFARVTLIGRTVTDVFRLDIGLLHDNEVFVAEDGALRRRNVDLLRVADNTAYISGGLTSDDLIITEDLNTAVEGMRIDVLRDNDNGTSTGDAS